MSAEDYNKANQQYLEDLRLWRKRHPARKPQTNKIYTDSRGHKIVFLRHPSESDEDYEKRFNERMSIYLLKAEINQKAWEEKVKDREERAAKTLQKVNLVMSALTSLATKVPFTGAEYKQATEDLRLKLVDTWHDYKKGLNATLTAAELALSGGSLLGAYANWRKWATAANANKQLIANLLTKAQKPMLIGGAIIDAYLTLDALSEKNTFDAAWNGVSTGLGVTGSVGASDIFLNSNNPRVDRVLDALGILLNVSDLVKFGYELYKGISSGEQK